MPTEREYKYTKAKDETTAVPQSPKEQRQRYADLVSNSTLRTMHEIWESDRHGHVKTISLTGLVEHVDAATGRDARTTLMAVAASREQFEQLDLSRVKPADTLRHLNASVSKDMHALVPIGSATSVRGH
ncbi:MAG: hypothetical protein H0U13_04165 [Gemmatimonadaceae bacterium]|nr:hypothetical protein [Gemmatimonadaceae bacterium]